MKESRYGYFFIAPCIIVILVVLGFPMIYVAGISFFDYRPGLSFKWAGLSNYANVFGNQAFWIALKNTMVFTVISVIFHITLGMMSALLLNMRFMGRRLLRVLYLLPWMLSYVVGAIIWRWMLNGSYGIFNEILVRMGLIEEYISWLGSPGTAMFSIIIANIWKQFPFVMLMLIAGLQSIPNEQYEAARIDGAGSIRCFFSVTLPNMAKVLVVTSTLDFIWSFKQFDLINVMTGGGPGNSTEVLSSLVYQTFFNAFDFSLASANAIVLLFIVVVISVVYAKLVFKREAQND